MKAFKSILIISSIPIILFLIWFGIVASLFFFARDQSGTHGNKINLSENPNSAFLTIDLMNYATRRNSGILNVFVDQKRADALIEKNNTVIDYFRKNNTPVIFIYQAFEKWTPKSLFITWVSIKGTYKAQFDSRLHKEANDPEFNKPKSDAFSNSDLQNYLTSNKTGTLYIGGTAAEACVYLTVWGARNRGYQVYVIDEATYCFEPAKKDQIYAKYKSLGANVISMSDLQSIQNRGKI